MKKINDHYYHYLYKAFNFSYDINKSFCLKLRKDYTKGRLQTYSYHKQWINGMNMKHQYVSRGICYIIFLRFDIVSALFPEAGTSQSDATQAKNLGSNTGPNIAMSGNTFTVNIAA